MKELLHQNIIKLPGMGLFLFFALQLNAQDETADSTKPEAEVVTIAKPKPVKNTFDCNWVQDNQSVMVPIKGTLEMDIQHRFGTIKNRWKDAYGIFAPSNIRIGMSYVVKNNIQVGLGATKERMQCDLNGKLAIIRQSKTKQGWPLSVTYFGNVVMDTRDKSNFVVANDRYSYFNQLIIARKISDKLSLQLAPSLSHFNNVEGYVDENGKIQPKMKNDHFAIAFSGRYRMTPKTNFMANYDQPLTQHAMNNPHPNISFGVEMVTSSHAFQVFMGNYQSIIPQSNNLFNKNDFQDRGFLIGFNITRLWNF
jgi:hypothetical protein